jgi:uncharacterized membrane protein
MQTGRGFERLVNFTDAVVAIALTLLVLPLVETPAQFTVDDGLAAVWTAVGPQVVAFLISFLVIWSLWRAHHRIMEHFRAYDGLVMTLHLLWLLTIVLLPFTTELLSSPLDERAAVPVYLVNLLVSTAALCALELRGRRRPTLLDDSEPVRQWLADRLSWTTQAIILLALALSFIHPAIGLWTLLLLTADGAFDRRARRRRRAAW